jgi:hypothetical protein
VARGAGRPVAAPDSLVRVLIAMSGPATEQERAVHARRLPGLLARLGEAGDEITVALLGDAAGLRADLAPAVASVRVLRPPVPPGFGGALAVPGAALALHALVREIRPDVLEGDEPLPAVASGLVARAVRRTPLVYRRHHQTGRRRLLVASRLAARLADLTAVSSEAGREQAARDDRTPADRILVTRSGAGDPRTVGDAEVRAARDDLGIAPDARVVGVVSRLRAEKGIDVLLAAVDRLDSGPVVVVVAGAGPEERSLRAIAERIRVPVHFLGHQRDVALWLRVADVVAIPSRREAFGRTTIEAMAAGRAIVASRVGGLGEAIEDGVSGLLVDPEQPEALAAGLAQALHAETSVRLGRAARARYEERFTLEHMAQSWRRAWEAAMTLTHGSRC